MADIIEIRGVRIGEGIPKIIIPIVESTREEIIRKAESLADVRGDIVEWRADWFEEAMDPAAVDEVLRGLRGALGNTPLLFTFRTLREGGEKAIDPEDYAALNISVAKSGFADLIDVEIFTGDEIVREIIESAHEGGVKVVGSSHDFDRTPEKDEIVGRLRKMQRMGADIPKIAVMPQNRKDVLTLLLATEEMTAEYADHPIITMSMSGTGLISRLCGEVFGSSCTFGAVGKASAPGQMNAEDLDTVLELIHKSL
ncbi:MAG: type I 3-dehydroquinate dehydratase [Lachnospiraceae bacterium]|nr:type I 3-dehydroquinate dehydratase [Lachnospiraceae bacterium]